MNNHTPGPWNRNINPASRYPLVFAGSNTYVARVNTDGVSEAEADANCNLIAAAPYMLAALQQIARHLEGIPAEGQTRAEAEIYNLTVEVLK